MPRQTSSRLQFKTSGPSPSPTKPCEATKREGGAATALSDLSGDLKPFLNYSRDTLVLGHILTMVPLGLSSFFSFYGYFYEDFLNVWRLHRHKHDGNFFSILAIPSPIFVPTLFFFLCLAYRALKWQQLSEMPSTKTNEIPVQYMAESFLAKKSLCMVLLSRL